MRQNLRFLLTCRSSTSWVSQAEMLVKGSLQYPNKFTLTVIGKVSCCFVVDETVPARNLLGEPKWLGENVIENTESDPISYWVQIGDRTCRRRDIVDQLLSTGATYPSHLEDIWDPRLNKWNILKMKNLAISSRVLTTYLMFSESQERQQSRNWNDAAPGMSRYYKGQHCPPDKLAYKNQDKWEWTVMLRTSTVHWRMEKW